MVEKTKTQKEWAPFNPEYARGLFKELRFQLDVIEGSGKPIKEMSQERLTKLAIALRDLKKEIGKLSITKCYWCGGNVVMGQCENDHNADAGKNA